MQNFPGVTEARLLGAKDTEKYMRKHRSFSLMTKAPLQKNYFSMQKTILRKMKGLIKKYSLVSLYFYLLCLSILAQSDRELYPKPVRIILALVHLHSAS